MVRSEAAAFGAGALSPEMLSGCCCSRARVALGCRGLKCLSFDIREKGKRERNNWSLISTFGVRAGFIRDSCFMANITFLGFFFSLPPSVSGSRPLCCSILAEVRCGRPVLF